MTLHVVLYYVAGCDRVVIIFDNRDDAIKFIMAESDHRSFINYTILEVELGTINNEHIRRRITDEELNKLGLKRHEITFDI